MRVLNYFEKKGLREKWGFFHCLRKGREAMIGGKKVFTLNT